MKLLTSGDIELNPGPDQNLNSQTILSVTSTMLNLRLRQLGLRPVDVGGEGDCFFRAVSHQLNGDRNHHLLIRQAGVQYLSSNPERLLKAILRIHGMNIYVNAKYMVRCTVCTNTCRLSKCSNSYYRISLKFCWRNFDRAALFSTTSTNNNIFRSFG